MTATTQANKMITRQQAVEELFELLRALGWKLSKVSYQPRKGPEREQIQGEGFRLSIFESGYRNTPNHAVRSSVLLIYVYSDSEANESHVARFKFDDVLRSTEGVRILQDTLRLQVNQWRPFKKRLEKCLSAARVWCRKCGIDLGSVQLRQSKNDNFKSVKVEPIDNNPQAKVVLMFSEQAKLLTYHIVANGSAEFSPDLGGIFQSHQ